MGRRINARASRAVQQYVSRTQHPRNLPSGRAACSPMPHGRSPDRWVADPKSNPGPSQTADAPVSAHHASRLAVRVNRGHRAGLAALRGLCAPVPSYAHKRPRWLMTDGVAERHRAGQLARHYRDQEGLTMISSPAHVDGPKPGAPASSRRQAPHDRSATRQPRVEDQDQPGGRSAGRVRSGTALASRVSRVSP